MLCISDERARQARNVILAKMGIFDLHQLKTTPCRFFLGFFMKS